MLTSLVLPRHVQPCVARSTTLCTDPLSVAVHDYMAAILGDVLYYANCSDMSREVVEQSWDGVDMLEQVKCPSVFGWIK